MDKMKLAHEWAIELLRAGDNSDDVISCEWRYADAMCAEAEKRKPSGFPDALREGWQPDWSQAPEWAIAWTYDKNAALWWSEAPEIHKNIWFIDGGVWQCADAPSFDYQGDWRESLRGRPQ